MHEENYINGYINNGALSFQFKLSLAIIKQAKIVLNSSGI